MPNTKNIQMALNRGIAEGNFYPNVFIVETCSHCNLSCTMCPNKNMPSNDLGYIDIELFRNVIIDISPFCEFLMLYWMGEPFLHPDLPELLKIARSHIHGKIVLSSNMTHLNESLATSILSNVDILICCIDRWDKTAYEKNRNGSVFEKVVSNTERILRQRKTSDNCEIIVKALDIDNNQDEFNLFSSYWKPKGAYPLLAWLNDWAGTFNKIRKVASIPIPHQTQNRVACADLWFKLAMNWKGEVQTCCFDWNYSRKIGHYIKGDDWLFKAWQSKKMVDLRQAQINGDWGFSPMCKACTTWAEEIEMEAYLNLDRSSYFIVF